MYTKSKNQPEIVRVGNTDGQPGMDGFQMCVCMPLCSNLTFTAAVDLIYQNPSVDYATNPQKRVSNYLTKHNLVILLIKIIPP